MKLITQLILILLLTFTVMSTNADAMSGQKLLMYCDTDKNDELYYQDNAHCVGYIAGTIEAFDIYATTYSVSPVFCLPKGATYMQLKMVVLNYIKDNPQELHYKAGVLINLAVRGAFPCKRDEVDEN